MFWRKPGGYTEIRNNSDKPIFNRSYTVAPGGNYEVHSFTCCNCNKVTFVASGCDPVELGGRCTCCDDLICKDCVGFPCDPIEKKLARAEAIGEILRIGGVNR